MRARIDASIASRLNLSASQRSMMHLLSRATGSALQALGNPNDSAAAFAQDFLGSVMSGLPMPQAQSRAPQAPSQDAAAQGPRQGANAQERPAAQAAQPQQTRPATQSVTVAAGDTLESLARQLYGSRWRAGLPVLMADNQITTNAWGSPLIRPGQSLQARPLDGLRASQIEQLSRLGGQVIGRNARGLNLREQIERIRAQAPAAPATPMRPSKPALPEWARPQDLAPTVENARRLGLPQTARPETSHSPSAERPQAPLPPVENLYAPAHGFYQERMRMATQGMMDPDASWMDRAVYAALGLGVTPLAMVEALGTEAYNSLNNASLAGQYWARGEMAANASDANVARLQAALHGAAAMNGLLGPAALTRPAIRLPAEENALTRGQGAGRQQISSAEALQSTPPRTRSSIPTESSVSRTELNHRVDDGLQYIEYQDGVGWKWPENSGFVGKPRERVLERGVLLDRVGEPVGSFLAPAGTAFDARALAPGAGASNVYVYEVIKPLPVLEGEIAPAFGQPGGGVQILPNVGTRVNVQWLIENEYLTEVAK